MEEYLHGCAAEPPDQGVYKLFTEGFGLPVRPGPEFPLELAELVGDAATKFENVERAWLIGLVGDEVFAERAEAREETDEKHDGIVLFLLDGPKWNDRAAFRDMCRALNRGFKQAPVVALFRHQTPRGLCMTIATCERSEYKVTHLEGEKAGQVTLSSPIQLRDVKEVQSVVLEEMHVQTDYLEACARYADVVSHWAKILTSKEIDLLVEEFKQWAGDMEEIPSLHQFRDRFSYRGLQLISSTTGSYRKFLLKACPEMQEEVEDWVLGELEAAIRDYWETFGVSLADKSVPALASHGFSQLVSPEEFAEFKEECDAFRGRLRPLGQEAGESLSAAVEPAVAEVDEKILAEMSDLIAGWHAEFDQLAASGAIKNMEDDNNE